MFFSKGSIHAFDLQIDLKICPMMKFDRISFFVKSQSAVLNFCHLTIFFAIIILLAVLLRRVMKLIFSVKSSWEIH